MKNKNILKINIIYLTAITLVAVVFLLGYAGILQNDIFMSILIQIMVMFAIPLLLYNILMRKNLKSTLSDCGLKRISGKMIGISILLGFVLYFINSFVADAFAGIISLLGYESLGSSSTQTITYGTLFKELILSCILPGFCEEFLHRGIMLHAHKKHANPRYCLIISSILFGLMHLNIRQFFYACVLGYLMGYVSLAADSIIPSMIIHFMNNFLSNYFFYGTFLNWPLAKFVNFATNFLANNIFIFIIISIFLVCGLIVLFQLLTRQMLKERAKRDIRNIVTALQMEKLTIIDAQIKFNEVNNLLKHKATKEQEKKKFSFNENILLIASLTLGTLITISSFIWGII